MWRLDITKILLSFLDGQTNYLVPGKDRLVGLEGQMVSRCNTLAKGNQLMFAFTKLVVIKLHGLRFPLQ